MTSKIIACAAALLLAGPATAAFAQAKIKVGSLTCKGGEEIGLVLGSKSTYSCTYAPASGKPGQSYEATVTKIGLDIGITEGMVMVWTVLASTDAMNPRALAGNYYGASADASFGIGGGASVLVGGSDKSIVLQPVSVQGQTGLNLALGVAELSLR